MAMMAVGMALTLVSGIMQADAQKKAGDQAKALADLNAANTKTAADFKAEQLKIRATRQVAEGIIKGNEAKERSEYAISRVIALAGASGTNQFDKNVVNTIVGFEERGTLNQGIEMYKGKSAARDSLLGAEAATFSGISQADALMYEGESARQSGRRRSSATLVGTAGSMFSQYGKAKDTGMTDSGGGGSATGSGWTGTGNDSVAVAGW